MRVYGAKHLRRWQCRICNYHVIRHPRYRIGGGKAKRGPSEIVLTPGYVEALCDLSDELARLIRQHKGQAFNANLVTLNRAIRCFAINRSVAVGVTGRGSAANRPAPGGVAKPITKV
jgi:hypothetical protein